MDTNGSSELALQCSKHIDFLKRYAWKKLVHDEADAEDLAQKTIVHIIDAEARGKKVYEGRSALSTYLISVMRNVYRMEKRSQRRKENGEIIPLVLEDGTELSLPVKAMQGKDIEEESINYYAQSYLDRLPPLQRRVILLARDGMENPEIAQALGVTVASVKNSKNNARRQEYMIELRAFLHSGSKNIAPSIKVGPE